MILGGRRSFKVRVAWERRPYQRCSEKNRVTAGDARDQVILEGLCGALVRVCLVQVGGYKTKRESLAAHIILEAGWTFIVKHLEFGAKSLIGELGVEDGVGLDEL